MNLLEDYHVLILLSRLYGGLCLEMSRLIWIDQESDYREDWIPWEVYQQPYCLDILGLPIEKTSLSSWYRSQNLLNSSLSLNQSD